MNGNGLQGDFSVDGAGEWDGLLLDLL